MVRLSRRGLKYEQVNRVLVRAGGKWNRSRSAHIFTSDPREKLGLAMETGVSVDYKKELQAFFTPSLIAAKIVQLARVKGCSVLEPSAGHGALAETCARAGAKSIKCIDINPEYCEKLRADGLTDVLCCDFLQMPTPPNKQYDRVVMNPPFTKNQDIKHVDHALKFVAPGGRLVSVIAGNMERKWFKDIISKYDPEIYALDAGAFKDAGTNVRTVIVAIDV